MRFMSGNHAAAPRERRGCNSRVSRAELRKLGRQAAAHAYTKSHLAVSFS